MIEPSWSIINGPGPLVYIATKNLIRQGGVLNRDKELVRQE